MVDVHVRAATVQLLSEGCDGPPLLEFRFRATVALASVLALAAQRHQPSSDAQLSETAVGRASVAPGSNGSPPGATKVDAMVCEEDAVRCARRHCLHHEWTPAPSSIFDGTPWLNMSPLTAVLRQDDGGDRVKASPGAGSSLSASPVAQSGLLSVVPNGSFIIRADAKPVWTPIDIEADSLCSTSPLFATPGALGVHQSCQCSVQSRLGYSPPRVLQSHAGAAASLLRKSSSAPLSPGCAQPPPREQCRGLSTDNDSAGFRVTPAVRRACSLSNHPLTVIHGERLVPVAEDLVGSCGWHRMCADLQRPAEKLLADLEEHYQAKMLLRQGKSSGVD